jgi:cyclic beta-1,2-glucan synthetase
VQGRPDLEARDDGVRIAAFAGEVSLPAGGTRTIDVVLGQAPDLEAARALVLRHRPEVGSGLVAAGRWWNERTAVLRIETDRPDFDRLVNDWLPYQVQTARLWARAGPDQRSGAYGFRDQLQDVIGLLLHDPALARRQILLHAAQQFREGDVLAWWHPSRDGATGLGARSRASDVHLWLPYAVACYVAATGDRGILEVELPFLEAPAIPRDRDGLLVVPRRSRDSASLHAHCRRAIARTLARRGRHGLPLLGSGDWNDALDRAGRRGRGESVWLGFFLHDVLRRFAVLEDTTRGAGAGEADRREARRLAAALAAMRRGERFVRLTTDAGEEVVRADALTAAWPVLSGAVDFETGRSVVEAALRDLVGEGGLRLTSPPYALDDDLVPGRIAEYPPGVRENGGQYTHGVSWLVDALVRLAEEAARSGDVADAARLRGRAVETWFALSPIPGTTPEALDRYGLAPHQQAADVYVGPGYGGRGGWSWYTGGAARMLSAAHAILGLRLENGELVFPDDLFAPKGGLRLTSLSYRGRTLRP